MRSSLLTVCLSSCALVGASFGLDSPPPVREAPAKFTALDRVAVIGASISAGFRIDGKADMFAKPTVDLAKIVDASLKQKHGDIVDAANGAFFMNPRGARDEAMKTLAEAKPTLIVALDYLFWFGYGQKKEEQRVPELEGALAELGRFDCPILLGDLPDMTLASQTPDPFLGRPMLGKSMLPSRETLSTLNAKIAEFAKLHPNVVVVPLADLTAKLLADGEFTVRGNTYPKGSIDRLMQADRLHTTLEGTCAVWIVALDTWLAKAKNVPESAFEFDIAKLSKKFGEPKKDAVPAGAPGAKDRGQPVPK